jgi:uncharacterized oligopeptide transporter (OPT) family protein
LQILKTEMTTDANPPDRKIQAWSFLPSINTPKYHLLLGAVTIFILGPLGAISAAYMNFSLGFFVGGQVLAGILGSVVTFGYGSEGKHGANYIQSMAASVANLAGMGILLQAMVWLGLKEPPVWQLILFFTCIGMFGVGAGMLYTPILVDKMQLTFPSGFAVANILRALTDKTLLKRSIAKLGGGTLAGFVAGFGAQISGLVAKNGATYFNSLSYNGGAVGAGMVVGARIAIPSLVVASIGLALTPWLRRIGWLKPGEPYKTIGFVIALGTILGAAILDLSIIGCKFIAQWKEKKAAAPAPGEDWKKVSTPRLIAWVVFWGIALVFVAGSVLHLPLKFVFFALLLTLLFVLINGIADGISDWNPLSSAFVVCVFLMASLGLRDPGIALMCASIILISCNCGVDMQQDRSTGWRLGTNRTNQFRYQVVGLLMGAILAVALAKLFMWAYPVLQVNQFDHPDAPGLDKWQSSMTFKFIGAIKDLTSPNPVFIHAIAFGMGAGFVIESLRKLIKANAAYKQFVQSGQKGRAADFVLDAFILSSPYASSFGGFVIYPMVGWFAIGGLAGSLLDVRKEHRQTTRQKTAGGTALPDDMSDRSLVGGGLIAGDSLASLALGIYLLVGTLFNK